MGRWGVMFKVDDINLIILIFKTARVARLVPPTKVVDLSARINLSWFMVLTPCFYWKLFLERREGAKRVNKDIATKKKSNGVRHSWGGLEIATMAAIKAMTEKEREMKEKGNIAYAGYKAKKWAENSKWKDMIIVNYVVHQYIPSVRCYVPSNHSLIPFMPLELIFQYSSFIIKLCVFYGSSQILTLN